MKKGDKVKLIDIKQAEYESDNWAENDKLRLGNKYHIDVIDDNREEGGSAFIKLRNHSYYHPIEKFEMVDSSGISEEAKQHLKDYTDFLLKAGYCDIDVYSEPPTAIDQYLKSIR